MLNDRVIEMQGDIVVARATCPVMAAELKGAAGNRGLIPVLLRSRECKNVPTPTPL